MKVFYGIDAVDPPIRGAVLTIGNFDGVHRAHQQLLAQAGLFAANTQGPVTVLTFEPHPLTVVAPDKAPPRLTSPEEKIRRLKKAGADVVVVARSEPGLLRLQAEVFVEDVIHRRFNPTHVVEGPSFGFGRGRKGTPALLKKCAAQFGCEVHILDPVKVQIDQGETLLVSSSLIRQLIQQGKVHRAVLCLGRAYTLTGNVVSGEERGRTLGFPTANLAVRDQLIPGEGVYAGRAFIHEKGHPCAISIGCAPTFGPSPRRIEAYVLDFSGDLYGQSIRLEFSKFLRGQRSFESPEALARQLASDVQAVRDHVDSLGVHDNRPKDKTP